MKIIFVKDKKIDYKKFESIYKYFFFKYLYLYSNTFENKYLYLYTGLNLNILLQDWIQYYLS